MYLISADHYHKGTNDAALLLRLVVEAVADLKKHLHHPVASARGELTIDAFPTVQVLWMCRRAGAMGVILGVIVSATVESKQRSILSSFP